MWRARNSSYLPFATPTRPSVLWINSSENMKIYIPGKRGGEATDHNNTTVRPVIFSRSLCVFGVFLFLSLSLSPPLPVSPSLLLSQPSGPSPHQRSVRSQHFVESLRARHAISERLLVLLLVHAPRQHALDRRMPQELAKPQPVFLYFFVSAYRKKAGRGTGSRWSARTKHWSAESYKSVSVKRVMHPPPRDGNILRSMERS